MPLRIGRSLVDIKIYIRLFRTLISLLATSYYEDSLSRIGSVRLIAYKRIGRVYSLEVLRRIVEESRDACKGEGKD